MEHTQQRCVIDLFFFRIILSASVVLSAMSVFFCIEIASHNIQGLDKVGELLISNGTSTSSTSIATNGTVSEFENVYQVGSLDWWMGVAAIVPDYATFVILPTAVIALSIM